MKADSRRLCAASGDPMNVFTRTLALVCFAVAPAFAHAEPGTTLTPSSVGECHTLACFGQLALREKVGDGSVKLPITLYTQAECDMLAGITPAGSCKVMPRPHFASRGVAWVLSGETRDYNWHDLASYGAVYIGELFYDRSTINAVGLATKAECDMINAAMEPDGQVPCFHMDALPPHFTAEQVRDSLR